MISNSSICDVERKGREKDNNKKDSGVKRKGRKKDNSKNVNINNEIFIAPNMILIINQLLMLILKHI